jgi:MFS family permease
MNIKQDGIAPNAGRLMWAGFMAILAAGIGFGVRGGIFADWGSEFGFTAKMLGDIGGAGFTGFCFGIIIGGVVCDKLGYGKLVLAAFALHIASAVVTLAASPTLLADGAIDPASADAAFQLLYWGMFLFALANGTLEAVANPLVATLFPKKRTHYLNILHASWPAGLVLGGAIGWILGGSFDWHWKSQLALYLIPTALYGWMFFGQKMPKSEASEKGLSLGQMFKDVGILGGLVICYLLFLFFSSGMGLPDSIAYGISGACLIAIALITNFSLGAWLLFVLFGVHALVGAVELGTDGWIQNITGNLLTPSEGKILFIWTSAIMMGLRFSADFIQRRLGLSPIGILCACAGLATVGLLLASSMETFVGALLALGIYAIGKTFFWPTMLAVASDRYPRTGAIAISIMGGIGMMSAGLIGSPGLGYAKDRFAGEALLERDAAIYAEYQAEEPSSFLKFKDARGLDGSKFGAIQDKLNAAREGFASTENPDPEAAFESLTAAELAVHESSIEGDRRTLKADAIIPAAMTLIYLLLLFYFKSIGGYRAVHLETKDQS